MLINLILAYESLSIVPSLQPNSLVDLRSKCFGFIILNVHTTYKIAVPLQAVLVFPPFASTELDYGLQHVLLLEH